MLVYRLESITGAREGPFGSGLAELYCEADGEAMMAGRESISCEVRAGSTQVHRSGIYDQLPVTRDHIFGCETLNLLRLWFPSPAGCKAMAEAGCVLRAYEVPEEHVLFGPAEVAFDRRHAECVALWSPRDLHGTVE